MKKFINVFTVLLLMVGCQSQEISENSTASKKMGTDVNEESDTTQQSSEPAVSDTIPDTKEEIQSALDPQSLKYKLQKGEAKFDFYASFTEPFWTLYFMGDEVLFDHLEDVPSIYKVDHRFNPNKFEQTISFSNGDATWKVVIKKDGGSDGMSEIEYPYSVVMDETFYGGGGVDFVTETPE